MAALPLRICMLNGTFAPIIGGAERQMQQQARLLRARGHQVQIITYRVRREWPRKEIVDDLPVTRTGGIYIRGKLRRRWGLALLPVLWQLIKQRKHYDLIQIQQTIELSFAGVLAGRLLCKPVISRMASSGATNDLRLMCEHDGLVGRWMARTIRRSNATFVALASTAVAELRAMGISEERIRGIPNGVDVARFASVRAAVRERVNIRRVICVGHLEYIKGIDVLLRAWQLVVRAVPDARLQIIGGGSQRDALLALTHDLALDASVEFAGETNDVLAYLAQAECFVLPSRTEGMPNALLEAMAGGLSCIATRVGACGDLIQERVTGLLVEPEDAPALAGAMLAFMTDPARAHDCARRARDMVEEQYDIRQTVQRYEELYWEILGRRGAPPAEVGHESWVPI